MPLSFLRRDRKRKAAPPPPPAPFAPDTMPAEEYSLRFQFHAKSGNGVRLGSEGQLSDLPALVAGVAVSPVEVIEPVGPASQDAAPRIVRPDQALLWINAHHHHSPIARHALYVLESLDAIDLAYETLVVGLLYGETDGDGLPRFDAIVGGLISFWDDNTGDLIVRPVVGWGGSGARGDTDRMGRRLLTRLMTNVLASQGAQGLHALERPVAGSGHRVCEHCGFAMLPKTARYCPKCGMRQEH